MFRVKNRNQSIPMIDTALKTGNIGYHRGVADTGRTEVPMGRFSLRTLRLLRALCG